MGDLKKQFVCKGCRDEQLHARRSPRLLKVLPNMTMGYNEKKKQLPVFACEYCDGPAYELAVRSSEKRQG